MPKKDEPTADEMAQPPAEQPVEDATDIPEPPSQGDYPDAPILPPEAVKGEILTIIDGFTFTKQYQGDTEPRKRCGVVFRPDDAIVFKDREGEKHTLAAGEVGKFFTSSRKVVFAIEHWAVGGFATAKRVKVIADPDVKRGAAAGKALKFVSP